MSEVGKLHGAVRDLLFACREVIPFKERRTYSTQDVIRRLPDGTLQYEEQRGPRSGGQVDDEKKTIKEAKAAFKNVVQVIHSQRESPGVESIVQTARDAQNIIHDSCATEAAPPGSNPNEWLHELKKISMEALQLVQTIGNSPLSAITTEWRDALKCAECALRLHNNSLAEIPNNGYAINDESGQSEYPDGQAFFMSDLKKMTGRANDTIQKRLVEAGIRKSKVGEHNRKYSSDEVRAFLNKMIETARSSEEKTQYKQALAGLIKSGTNPK